MIPLTKPALITIAINSFNGAWNDFLGPLLYIQNQEKIYTPNRFASFPKSINDTVELFDGGCNTGLITNDPIILFCTTLLY